jgi:hypothetical protein
LNCAAAYLDYLRNKLSTHTDFINKESTKEKENHQMQKQERDCYQRN